MRTDAVLKEICDSLRMTCGDFHGSCRRAGVSVDFVTKWIKDDQEAAREIEEAQRVGYMGLESAALQRGVHGIDKAVYYKGEVVGYEKQYSDSLLVKMMEARIPAYKKGEAANNNTFNGPTQINIMPRAENFEQWLEMKKSTLADRAAAKALEHKPKVPEILQGEYVEIVDEDDQRPLAALKGLL